MYFCSSRLLNKRKNVLRCDFPFPSDAHRCAYLSFHLSLWKRKGKKRKVMLWQRHRHLHFVTFILNPSKQTHWHEIKWSWLSNIQKCPLANCRFILKMFNLFLKFNWWYCRNFGSVFSVEENEIRMNSEQVFWKNQMSNLKLRLEMKILKCKF